MSPREVALWVLSVVGGGGVAVIAIATVVWHFVKRWVDHRLETKLTTYKGELEREAEHLRHELQRQMIKAQLGTNRMYEVGPKLLVKLKRAYGAVSSLMGLSFAPDFEQFERADLERALDNRRLFPAPLLTREREQLLSAWVSESPEILRTAREDVRKLFFRQQVGHAGSLARRAHNHAVLNAVFLPPDLAEYAAETTNALVRAHIDAEAFLVDHVGSPTDASKAVQAVGVQILKLEKRMRGVLAPEAAARSEHPAKCV